VSGEAATEEVGGLRDVGESSRGGPDSLRLTQNRYDQNWVNLPKSGMTEIG